MTQAWHKHGSGTLNIKFWLSMHSRPLEDEH